MAEQGRVAVVTGGGSGIGRAVAHELLDGGFRVAVAGRRRETLDETIAGRDGTDVLAVPADVTDPASVDALFEAIAGHFGRVDVLFNNAGAIGAPAPFDEYPLDDWRTLVETNLTGAFLVARAAFKAMKHQSPRGGRIINNGSLSTYVPRPETVGYSATKHAVTGLTKSIALEGRPFQIACGQIDVGNAATAMTDGMSAGARQADGSLAPEPRMEAGDVGRAVAYMASLPLDANVLSMTVMATAMPFVGRG